MTQTISKITSFHFVDRTSCEIHFKFQKKVLIGLEVGIISPKKLHANANIDDSLTWESHI